MKVWVSDDDLLRRMTYEMTQTIPGAGEMTMKFTMELFDYGTNVEVNRPPTATPSTPRASPARASSSRPAASCSSQARCSGGLRAYRGRGARRRQRRWVGNGLARPGVVGPGRPRRRRDRSC